MMEFFKRRWFLLCLLIVIPGGLVIGHTVPVNQIDEFQLRYVDPSNRYIVAFVLFLMSVTLDIRKLAASVKAPAPVGWACVVNYVLLPLLAIPLAKLQLTKDFAVGLLITACVPSTMASASVWTRKANGNDAVSLLCTIVTNGVCFLVTPLWLKWVMSDAVALDSMKMIERLFFTALLPISIGQLVRGMVSARSFADRHKTGLGAIAQILILLLILWSSVDGGGQLQSSGSKSIGLSALLVIVTSCIALHFAGVAAAFYGSRLFGFRRDDAVATVFSGSQKTLPIGIYIATNLLAGRDLPFAAFPILIFHASQLILDTFLIDPLAKWESGGATEGNRE